MKFISWNVNGLRAVVGKNFKEVFEGLNADFFCLQETKMQEGQLDLQFPGYQSYWNYAEKKGYSGTAVFTKHQPISVTYGLGIEEHDQEGRVITLEMQDFYLVCVYTPNSQDGLKRLDYRMKWEDDFRAYLLSLDAKKPVLVCGDMNVAHQEIDLKNPKTNHMNAGFTDEEREKFTQLLAAGFTDTWRTMNPDVKDVYSWWSYRFQARAKNTGWRIDYWLVSNRLFPKVTDAKIYTGTVTFTLHSSLFILHSSLFITLWYSLSKLGVKMPLPKEASISGIDQKRPPSVSLLGVIFPS